MKRKQKIEQQKIIYQPSKNIDSIVNEEELTDEKIAILREKDKVILIYFLFFYIKKFFINKLY